jgi:hypothetical protein
VEELAKRLQKEDADFAEPDMQSFNMSDEMAEGRGVGGAGGQGAGGQGAGMLGGHASAKTLEVLDMSRRAVLKDAEAAAEAAAKVAEVAEAAAQSEMEVARRLLQQAKKERAKGYEDREQAEKAKREREAARGQAEAARRDIEARKVAAGAAAEEAEGEIKRRAEVQARMERAKIEAEVQAAEAQAQAAAEAEAEPTHEIIPLYASQSKGGTEDMSRLSALEVRVKIPASRRLENLNATTLDIQAMKVLFSIDEAPLVRMEIPLPYRVQHETAKAKFSRKKQQLTLTLALC